MKRHQLAALACKILGLYALLQALAQSWFVVWLFVDRGSEFDSGWVEVVPFAVYLAAAVSLLAFAGPLGARLAGSSGSEDAELRIDPGFEVVAIGLVGLLDLVRSVPALMSSVAFMVRHADETWFLWSPDGGTVAQVLRVALGLWLLLGARGLANGLRRLRGAGLKPEERPWETEPDATP